MRSLNLPLAVSAALQLRQLVAESIRLGTAVSYYTVFPSRRIFRRFVEQIAWGTSVWVADEPANVIHFVPVAPTAEPSEE